MAHPVEAYLILCDAAVAEPATGKVHMLGAGWSTIGSPMQPHAVVALLKIPWDRANTPIPLKLDLYGPDGAPVEVETPSGDTVVISNNGTVEVGRPPGIAPGSMLDASFVINVGPLPLDAGRYEWRLRFAELEVPAPFTVH